MFDRALNRPLTSVCMIMPKFDVVMVQKQPSRGVLRKECLENMQQINIGEHPCQSVILVKLQSNFTEIALRHGCSPVSAAYF